MSQVGKSSKRRFIVEIIEARNLSPRDRNGASDPFVVIYNSLEVNTNSSSPSTTTTTTTTTTKVLKTRTLKKTLDPVWNQRFTIQVSGETKELLLEVFHKGGINLIPGAGGGSKTMGIAIVSISDFSVARRDFWYTLKPPLLSQQQTTTTTNKNNSETTTTNSNNHIQVSGEIHIALLPLPSIEEDVGSEGTNGSDINAQVASGTSEDSQVATSTAATAATSSGIGSTKHQQTQSPSNQQLQQQEHNGFSIVDVEGSESSQQTTANANIQQVVTSLRPDDSSSTSIKTSSVVSAISRFLRRPTAEDSKSAHFNETANSTTATTTTTDSTTIKLPAIASVKSPVLITEQQQKENSPTVLSPSANSVSPKPQGGAGTRRPTIQRKILKRPPTAIALKTNGLVDSFFIVGKSDLLSEIDERFADRLSDDLCSLPFSAEISDAYPWLGTDDLPPSIWMFCSPSGFFIKEKEKPESFCFPFVITSAVGKRNFVTCLLTYEQLETSITSELNSRFHKPEETKLFFPKCYCIISSIPCFTFFREWMKIFNSICLEQNNSILAESLISHLLKGIPRPIPGGPALSLTIGETKLSDVWIPNLWDIPLLDLPIRLLFATLKPDSIIEIVNCMLLEEKILIVSKNATILTLCCEALIQLLYPLKWAHVFVPILPLELIEYIHSPTPFIIGLTTFCASKIPAGTLCNLIVVDIDSGTLKLPEGQISLPELPQQEFNILSSDLKELCESEIDITDKLTWNPWSNAPTLGSDFNFGIRAAFLRFFCSVLQNFRSFLLYVRVFRSPVAIFNKKSFLSTKKKANDFYQRFLDSQAFAVFLDDFSWPRDDLFSKWSQKPSLPTMKLQTIIDGIKVSAPNEQVIIPNPPTMQEIASSPTSPTLSTINGLDLRPDVISLIDIKRPFYPETVLNPLPANREEQVIEEQLSPESTQIAVKDKETISMESRIERITKLLSNGEAEKIDQAEVAILMETFKSEIGRAFFASSMIEKRRESTGKLNDVSYGLLGDLCRNALREAAQQKDLHTPQLYLDLAEQYYRIFEGTEDSLMTRLRSLEVWQNGLFWESFFFIKAGAACTELYKPSIIERIRSWKTLDDAAKVAAVNAEQEAIFRILADFAFKMTNLAVSPATTRRFVGKMCTAGNIDDERRKICLQLVYNMSKMKLRDQSELTEADEAQTKLGFKTGLDAWVPVGISNADSNGSSWHNTFSQLLSSDARPLLKTLVKAAGSSVATTQQLQSHYSRSNNAIQTQQTNVNYVSRLLEGHTAAVLCLAHFPFHVASGSADTRVRVWDTRTASCVAILQNHVGWVNALQLDHFSGRLLSGSYDRTVKLWDLSKMTKIRSLRGHRAAISCLKAHPRGTISASFDSTAVLWDIRSKRSLLRMEGHTGPITCMSQRGEEIVITGSRDSSLRIWDLRTGRTLAVLGGGSGGIGHSDWVRCCLPVEMHSTGKWLLLSGGYDGKLILWDPEAGSAIKSLVAHDGTVNDLCLCGDGSGTEIISAGADGAVKQWNVSDLHCERILGNHGDEALAIVPFMNHFISTASCDSSVKIWEPSSPSSSAEQRVPCRQTLFGHTQKVTSLCSVGASSLVSGSWDSTIRLFDFSQDFR